MEVDIEEMLKQQKEEILKSGKYVQVEILVGKNTNPLCHVECKASTFELAHAIKTMEETKKAIIKKDPNVLLALKCIDYKETIVKDSREEGFEKMKGGD